MRAIVCTDIKKKKKPNKPLLQENNEVNLTSKQKCKQADKSTLIQINKKNEYIT